MPSQTVNICAMFHQIIPPLSTEISRYAKQVLIDNGQMDRRMTGPHNASRRLLMGAEAPYCFSHWGCIFSCFYITTIVLVAVVTTMLEMYCNTHPHLEHQFSSTDGELALE